MQVMSVDHSKTAHPAYHENRTGTDKVLKSEHSGKDSVANKADRSTEITAAGIAETIEIVQAARIITTETKATLHKGQEK